MTATERAELTKLIDERIQAFIRGEKDNGNFGPDYFKRLEQGRKLLAEKRARRAA